jgi:hypothetical protein
LKSIIFMSRVRQTKKSRLALRPAAQKETQAPGEALGESWAEGVESLYELLGLSQAGCSSVDSVIQRLHSRQLRVWSSAKPSVAGTVRAKRKDRPQLGQA